MPTDGLLAHVKAATGCSRGKELQNQKMDTIVHSMWGPFYTRCGAPILRGVSMASTNSVAHTSVPSALSKALSAGMVA